MKKSSTYLNNKKLILLTLLLLLSVGQGFAGEYYARLTATATGEGKVYASTSEEAPSDNKYYTNFTSPTSKSKTQNDNLKFYAFAKANDGYAFNGWSNEENGKVVSTDNPYKVFVEAESPKKSTPSTRTVFAQFVKVTEQTITFLPSKHGSYTATDGTNTVKNSGSMTTQKPVTLTATPASGYKFFGWYTTTDGGNTKNYFSYNATTNEHGFTSSVSVGADFVSSNTPIFMIKGSIDHYTDLKVADKAASGNGTIVLISDGTLPIGNYSISKGNTLLIPYDDAYTVKTTKAEVTQTWAALKAYKTLTLQSGANITVQNGAAICVGGKQYSTSNPMGSSGGPGTPTGSYGCIHMSKGGNITLQSGSNLYAWGFITGQNMDEGNNTTGVGTIDAQNGANVYEDIVIADWHGGSATSGMDSKKKYFPFNQYFIPNIEVPLTINYGATLNTVSDISAGWGTNKEPFSVPVTFIAKSGGLFNMLSESSTAKVWYDATTDTQHFEFTGDNNLTGIAANINTGFGTVQLDASKYVMPMTSNFDIHIKSGSITIPSDVALLPGAKVTLDEGVDATINSGANVYIYDLDNWGLYAYDNYRKVYTFRPTKFKKYGQGDKNTKAADVAKVTGLSDAKLVVNGKLTVNGAIYTTNAGADICSDKGGSIVFATAPTASATTYQYVHGGSPAEVEIPVTAAQLHNADGSYVNTTGAEVGTTFYYNPSTGKWSKTDPSIVPPTFKYNDKGHGDFTLTNATNVTVDQVKSEMGKETDPVLSVDLTNATGNIDLASLRSTIDDATGNSNVLLYVATANTNNVQNVVTKGANGNYTASNFVITDKQPIDVPTTFTAAKVTYNRNNTKYSGKQQWGTICLPYTLNRTEGSNIRYYQLESVSGNTMTLKEVQTVEANTPAIYSVASNVNAETISFGGTNIVVSAYENKTVGDGIQLVGVQNKVVQLPAKSTNYYYISQNKFWQPTTNAVNIRPQRAYFKTSGGASLAKVLNIVEDGDATGIDNISTDDNEPTIVGIYNVNGMKQSELRSGINIVKMSDGTTKKVVIK